MQEVLEVSLILSGICSILAKVLSLSTDKAELHKVPINFKNNLALAGGELEVSNVSFSTDSCESIEE